MAIVSKQHFRAVLWVAIILAILPATFWFAGFIWYLFYGLNPFSAGLLGWINGLKDYYNGYLPGQGGLLLSTFIGSFFLIYGLAGAIYLFAYDALWKRALHGSASLANRSDLRGYKLFSKVGLIVGKSGKDFLRFGGQQFVILLAPTRSGKGVSLVIPNLLSIEDSVAVLDVKLENFKKTSKFREKVLGHRVYLFAPFAEDLDDKGEVFPFTHRYNPLSIVRSGVFREGDILSVATIIYPNVDPKNQFWVDQSRNLFLCICLLLFDLRDQRAKEGASSKLPDYPITIGEVLRQGSSRGLAMPLSEYLHAMIKAHSFFSPEFLETANSFLSNPPDTLGNIKSSFDAPLINWRSAIFDAATSASDFDLRRVRKDKMSIYLGIPPGRLKESPVIVRLFFTQLINLNTEKLKDEDLSIKHPCILILDEAPAIGRLPIIKDGSGYVAGFDLRYVIVAQSIAQLEDPELYGRYGTKTIMDNSGLQIVYPPKNNDDAKTISESLGYLTERSSSMSRGGGILTTRSESTSTSDQRRALMMPQEVKTMGQDEQIILMEYAKPIRCKKIKYYKDSFFENRLFKDWTNIPPIDALGYRGSVRNSLRAISTDDVDLHSLRLKESGKAGQLEVVQKIQCSPKITKDLSHQALAKFSKLYTDSIGIPADPIPKDAVISRKTSIAESRKILAGKDLGQSRVRQDFISLIEGGTNAAVVTMAGSKISDADAHAAFDGL